MSNDQSRRAFLKRTAALGVAGAAPPFVTSLAAIGEAAAATASDYKALVCVFLYGGCDYANTLTPYDQASYDLYQEARPLMAYDRSALHATALVPTIPLPGGRQYALAPTLAPLLPVFNAGNLAVVLNVGTLVQPTTRAQYVSNTARLPPRLFSHNDQQSYWQASSPEGAKAGWGGRIGDLLQSGNGTANLTCINASGNAVFLTGRTAIQYTVSTGGPIALLNNSSTLFGSSVAANTLRSLMADSQPHMFANEYAKIGKRGLETYAQVDAALVGAPAGNFPLFPAGNSLADQLKVVARLISVSQTLGAKRQVFFVSLGGFDLHSGLTAQHPVLLGRVGEAMRAFHDTMTSLGISDRVTTFTGSDFGRALQPNSSGSDHGWGGMHFVMGAAVKGGRIWGTPPAIGHNTPDDVGQGRLIPTISVDQYASTLSSWFGVSNGDMSTVLPNIGNYNASTWNLGFL